MAKIIETLGVKVTADITDFESKMNSLPAIAQKAASSIDGLGGKISSSMQKWGESVTSVGKKIQSFGDGMTNLGAKWSLAITAPLVLFGKTALLAAADFEKSMNTIQSVTQATAAEMAAMSKQALQLGKDTVFSAGDAAQAQLELGKAGLGVSDIMAAMPGILDLAAAGQVELGVAAKLTAGVLNAFSLEAAESTRVADLLAAAANASAADIGDLSLGMQQSSFAFAASGQSVEDLATSLAILTNVGLKGSDTGTALKNAFMQLLGPTKKSRELMAELGISVFDAAGNMKPLREIIDIFNTQLANMTMQERLAALDTIFLSDGMKAMIPILESGVVGFDAMREAVTQEGAAHEVATAKMKGLAGAIEYFKGTLDSLMIETSLPWLDQISLMIRGAADLIAKFGELDPVVQKNIVIFLAVVAVLGPVIIFVGMLISAVGAIVAAFGTLISAGGAVIGAIAALSAPILIVIAAVIALGLAWATNFMGIRDITYAVFGAVRDFIGNAVQAIRNFFSGSWSDIGQRMMQGIADGIRSAWNWVVDAAKGAAQAALDAAKGALGISSPSQVAADQIGVPFAQGIREGAMRGLGALSADITRGLDVTVRGIQPQISTAGVGGFSGSIPITINISGNADEMSVSRGARNGVIEALRQAGMA